VLPAEPVHLDLENEGIEMIENRTQRIEWDGKSVGFRLMSDGISFVKTRRRIGFIDVCPICKEKFSVSKITGVILIISNQVGIPNRFIHVECLEDKTYAYAFSIIAEDWKEAQPYKDWFPQ